MILQLFVGSYSKKTIKAFVFSNKSYTFATGN